MPYSASELPEGPIDPINDHYAISTKRFDYVLTKEGQIYIRCRDRDSPIEFVRGDVKEGGPDAHQWKLLDDIGLPYNASRKSRLSKDKTITEIAVASEIVAAVANTNQVYLFKPTDKKRPLYWMREIGSPHKGELFLPAKRRAWTLSCSVCDKEKTRKTDFMDESEKNSYFSDREGKKFKFGFTATIYVLSEDGRKITYWDTGLPPSFSRGFLVPDGMQGQDIWAAGSRVFLSAVDAEGKLHYFSRMHDYEINGACPGLEVDYSDNPGEQHPDGPDGVFELGYGIRKGPLQGWVEHSVENLPHVTHEVGICLTGQGDDKRELKIRGKNAEGVWGYYYKDLNDTEWTFCPTSMLPQKTGIPHSYNKQLPQTQKLDYKYDYQDSSGVTVELQGFHPFISDSEPCYIVLKHPDEQPVSLRIHAVDGYNIAHNPEHDEELVGTAEGEAKFLMGTLVLTQEQRELAQQKTAIGKYLKEHFLSYDGETKNLRILADNRRVTVKLGRVNLDNINPFIFKRELSAEEIAQTFYMKRAMDPELTVTPRNKKECAILLSKNKACLREIKAIFFERSEACKKHLAMDVALTTFRPLVSVIFQGPIKKNDPTYKKAVEDLELLLAAHGETQVYNIEGHNQEFLDLAKALLENRISQLEKMEEKFAQSNIVSRLVNQARLSLFAKSYAFAPKETSSPTNEIHM